MLHNGQIKVMEEALNKAKHLLIMIGSSNRSVSAKNPFTAEEREEVIMRVVRANGWQDRVTVRHLPDVAYSIYPNAWFVNVRTIVNEVTAQMGGEGHIGIIGHDKDASSFYLTGFPGLGLVKQPNYRSLNSTDLRNEFYDSGNVHPDLTHPEVLDWVKSWKESNPRRYGYLQRDVEFITGYRKKYPDQIYNTADALVVCNNHILLIERGNFPGKGLYALPGGFVNPGETFLEAAKRELREETMMNEDLLLKKAKMFDDPNRDPRRHIVSMVHHFELPNRWLTGESHKLPFVLGSDDARRAVWMPLEEVKNNPCKFFIDHWFIIDYMLSY